MSEPRQPGRLEQAAAVLSVAALTYASLPEQQQYWIKLAVLRKLHRLTSLQAWQQGHKAMDDELSGRRSLRYHAAYWLSRLRDRTSAELEAMRP